MTAVLLARHAHHAEVGRVLSGRSEIGLDAAGIEQAARLAARLAAVPIAGVVSSPRPRAIETAKIVASGHGLAVTHDDDLDEIDFGRWAGQAFTSLEHDAAWQAWNATRATAATPAGETMAAATARAWRAIRRGGGGPILFVSHADIIRGVVADVLGLSYDRMFAFDCDPASLTMLEVWDDGARVVSLNERP